jgi:Resolvase, N terminal domain
VKYAFARASTDDKPTALQLAPLRRAKRSHTYEDNGLSGASAKRPALSRCLKTLRDPTTRRDIVMKEVSLRTGQRKRSHADRRAPLPEANGGTISAAQRSLFWNSPSRSRWRPRHEAIPGSIVDEWKKQPTSPTVAKSSSTPSYCRERQTAPK